jgi:hypothetical protein
LPPAPRRALRAAAPDALALVGFVAVAVYKSGLTADLGRSVFAGPDPLKDVWVLAWVARHLGDPARVFEGNNFFPSHDAILFNDPLLGPALFAAPVLALGGSPVLAYNLAVLGTLVLGSAAFYGLARGLGASRGAALVAGVTVPYMPPQMQHLSHLNLLTLGGFALLIAGLLRLLRAPTVAVAGATGLAFAWQAGTSGYWAFACVFLSLIVVAFGWRSLREARVVGALILAAAVAAGFLLPYVRAFRALRATEGALARGTAERVDLSLDLVSGLWGSGAWVWRGVMPGPGDTATLAFPGLVVCALAVVGLWRGPRRAGAMLGAIAVAFFALALGPRLKVLGYEAGPGPLAALESSLPLFTAVRHPATFVALTLAALGLLAALGVSSLPGRRRGWITAAVLAAILLESGTPAHRRVPVASDVPAVYGRLQALPRAAILELPITPEGDSRRQWWSLHHGLDLVNGVGAFMPDRYVHLRRLMDREWTGTGPGSLEDTAALRHLKHHFPIGYVVLHVEAPPELRRSLDLTPSLEPLFDEAGARVYRLRRGGVGRVLRRAFRDDQFEAGVVAATVRGNAGTSARALFNDQELGRLALERAPREAAWGVRGRLRRGLNVLVLTAEGPAEAALELLDVSAR